MKRRPRSVVALRTTSHLMEQEVPSVPSDSSRWTTLPVRGRASVRTAAPPIDTFTHSAVKRWSSTTTHAAVPAKTRRWMRRSGARPEGLGERLVWAANISIHALHLDLTAAPEQLDAALDAIPSHLILSLGMVSGGGVEIPALEDEPRRVVGEAVDFLGDDRVWLAPSTPLSPTLDKAALALNYLKSLRASL